MPSRPFARKPGDSGPILPSPGNPVEQYLRAINDNLSHILRELEERTQWGRVYTLALAVIGAAAPETPVFDPPLFWIQLINDGAAVVQYKVPYAEQGWINLNPTETVAFRFEKARIPNVGLRVLAAGATANVRILGTF